MLRHLHIQHYALIDTLDIDFDDGFSVITGETGAGKSIMLGAIGLLLGQRVDAKTIKAGEQRCTIEAEFLINNPHITDFLEANDFSATDDTCIIRREITDTGKSRAFINDTPASVAQLKELGDMLIDIHSQHQNLLLGKEDFQLRVLDTVATCGDVLDHYRTIYKRYRETERELNETLQTSQHEQSEQDYLQFQFQQLHEAHLREGEQEQLEAEQRTLEHAEEIKTQLFQVSALLQGEEGSVVSSLHDAQRRLEGIANVYPKAEELASRLESCYIETKDIADEVEAGLEDVDSNPERLQQVNDRLNLLYELLHKHRADTITDLIHLHDDLQRRLSLVENRDTIIGELQARLLALRAELMQQADLLTKGRKSAADSLERGIIDRLKQLGMPNIQFKVSIDQADEPGPSGTDIVQFAFSANKNSPLLPIAQVASGGEVARVMLSLKATVNNSTQLPTIIFDEIDTGTSGHIAQSMARIMQEMSREGRRQVISITHLPQIAALGERHYRVYKEETAEGATTHIVLLTPQQRVEEVAHMLSGDTITQAAIDNAKELLSI